MPIPIMELISAIVLLIELVIHITKISYYKIKGHNLPRGESIKINKFLRFSIIIANEIFLFLLCLCVPFLLLLNLYHPFLDWSTFNIFISFEYDPFWFQIIGMAIFSFGILMIFLALSVIKERYALFWEAPVLGEGFAHTGIYSKVRHPIYGALIYIFIGYVIWFQSWLATLCLIPFLSVIKYAPEEEKWLLKRFGKDYEEYMKKTWRFFPKLS